MSLSTARTDAGELSIGDRLQENFAGVRQQTLRLTDGLGPEDMVVQSMEDASPTKWHMAHTTWFFEQFILSDYLPGYRPFDPDFGFLFNSYYNGAGPRHARPRRGLLTRPDVARVRAYRAHVDAAMADLLDRPGADGNAGLAALIELGCQHEQQHQELLLTDLLHALSCNPLHPAYREPVPAAPTDTAPPEWIEQPGGIHEIGHDGTGFAFDHEGPRHQVLLRDCRLASRLVTNGEWLAFISDGGYRRPELWLSDGWATVAREEWQAPLYWQEGNGGWHAMTLGGLQPVMHEAPVSQISYYEADAFARWAGKRLPTEQEWEVAAQGYAPRGNTRLGPGPATAFRRLLGMDAERLRPLPRLPRAGGHGRRIQRQVHGQPDGAARGILRHPGRPQPGQLPQFLLSPSTLAVHRTAPGGGR